MKLILCLAFIYLQFSVLFAATPRVVCYWPSWSAHTPEEIDPTLCTHIHYSFFNMDDKNNVIVESSGKPQTDLYKRLVALKQKNKDLKIMASLGGWGQPDVKFSNLISSTEKITQFINHTIDYLHKYGFDGLDLDWEYPVCWQADCKAGPASDRENFGKFLQQLRGAFDKQTPKLLTSAAVSGEKYTADIAYDYKALGAYLDYVNLMTYAESSYTDNVTEHDSAYAQGITIMEYYASKGIPKDKIVEGVPFYGVVFQLKDKTKHNIGAPSTGQGHLASNQSNPTYPAICDFVKHQNWTKGITNGHDPFVYHDNLWISYDDAAQIYQKSKWVKDNGYGGIIVWEITQDDVNKKCCNVANPLLKAINYGLYGKGSDPSTYGCE